MARFTMFFVVGLLETVLAYFLFSRADDHAYFLEVANAGLAAVPDYSQDLLDLKAKAAGFVFYVATAPSRWLGGHELAHLLWLRAIMLIGALSAFNWFRRKLAPEASASARKRAESKFMILILLYPGQIAWTASLLRDGVAMAFFFFSLACLRKDLRIFLAPVFLGGSLALRPEYAIFLVSLMVALICHQHLKRVASRILLLLGFLLLFSISTHEIQAKSAAFGQLAFSDGDLAYPLVTGALDLAGYSRILLQAVIDPISLTAPSFNPFGVAECLFLIYLLWHARNLMRHPSTRISATTIVVLSNMWFFAYFEIFVSGFSRHRLGLELVLITIISLLHAGGHRSRALRPSR